MSLNRGFTDHFNQAGQVRRFKFRCVCLKWISHVQFGK